MVDCTSVRAALKQGQAAGSPELAAHAAQCPTCAELLASPQLAQLLSQAEPAVGSAGPDFEAWSQRTAGLVQQERGLRARLRALSWRTQLAQGAGVAVLLLGLVLLTTPRADLGVYPLARLALTVCAYALISGIGLSLSMRPLWKRPVGKIGLVLAWLLVIIPFVIAALPVAHVAHPASLAGAGTDFVPRALGCFAFGSIIAAPVLLLLGLSDRTGLSRTNLALLLGTGAGFVGAISLEFHCPITHPIHLLAGHATVAFVWTAILFALSFALKQRRAT